MPGEPTVARGGSARFATPAMFAALAVYVLAVLTWLQPQVVNDGESYFGFLRRLLGDDVPGAYAYQFGAVLWDLPFVVAARGLGALGIESVGGLPLEEFAFTAAAAVAVGLLFPLGWLLLRDARLDHAGPAVLLAIAGSPLAYSVLFSPYDSHSVDALGATVLALLLLRASLSSRVTTGIALALGAVLGLLVVVRYANAVLAVGVAIVLLARRAHRPAVVAGGVAAAVAGLLLAVPLLLDIPYGSSATPALNEQTSLGEELDVDLLAPLKMLFTLERGLFLWTPLTLLAVGGAVLLWRRDERLRLLLVALAANAASLLAFHVVWGKYWSGGFGFSQRFLIGLFPLFLLGVAELLRRWGLRSLAVLVPCVLWSGVLALYHFYGYEGITADDGVDRVVELYVDGEETPAEFARVKLGAPVRDRWAEYGRLIAGD